MLNALVISLLAGLSACSPGSDVIVIDDSNGVLGATNAPVSLEVQLNDKQAAAAAEGRLALQELPANDGDESFIPVQVLNRGEDSTPLIVLVLPAGQPGLRKFKLVERSTPFITEMKVFTHPQSRQVVIEEERKKVLQYNYQTVFEKDVIRSGDEQLEQHVRTEKDTFITTSIYAVPRSDYIHPLYGLEGEMLTRDWPDGGHPHHRAVFWAWPEVEYGSERGDIYALQGIFARPTGDLELVGGPLFAQVKAENLWMWEDTEPIVKEDAVIRVYRSGPKSRIIDLTIQLLALKDSITIATRGTDSYGGLNLRMQFPDSQEISYHTDTLGSKSVRAWSDFSGIFKGAESPSGLMVLQHPDNPEYPGSWVEYPNLAWVQPTFPSPGTRYPLSTENPLVLRYRLIIHAGAKPDVEISEKRWDAFIQKTKFIPSKISQP